MRKTTFWTFSFVSIRVCTAPSLGYILLGMVMFLVDLAMLWSFLMVVLMAEVYWSPLAGHDHLHHHKLVPGDGLHAELFLAYAHHVHHLSS